METLLVSEVEANEPSAIPAVQEESTTSPEVVKEVETEEAKAPTDSNESEAPSGETETTETDEPEKKKNSFQERISELNRQKKEAQQHAEEMERRARSLEERLASSTQEDEPYPTLEAYGYDEQAYQKALVDYTTSRSQRAYQQARLEEEQGLLQEARQRQQQYMVQTFAERSNTFAETQPDFNAKLSDPNFVQTFKQSPSVQEAVLTSDNGPAMAYYLASNPQVAQEIASLSPVMAGMKLAGIESKLSAPVSVKPTNTPEPIKPVTPGGKVDKDPESMTPKEYVAWRRKQGR